VTPSGSTQRPVRQSAGLGLAATITAPPPSFTFSMPHASNATISATFHLARRAAQDATNWLIPHECVVEGVTMRSTDWATYSHLQK